MGEWESYWGGCGVIGGAGRGGFGGGEGDGGVMRGVGLWGYGAMGWDRMGHAGWGWDAWGYGVPWGGTGGLSVGPPPTLCPPPPLCPQPGPARHLRAPAQPAAALRFPAARHEAHEVGSPPVPPNLPTAPQSPFVPQWPLVVLPPPVLRGLRCPLWSPTSPLRPRCSPPPNAPIVPPLPP